MKAFELKNSIRSFTFVPIDKRDYYLFNNLVYEDLNNKHFNNIHPELTELLILIGLATGIRISWRIVILPDTNKPIKSIRLFGPRIFVHNLSHFFITFFNEYENYIAIWEKRHFYRLMVKRRTKGKTWANLPGRKEFISLKTRIFIRIYIKFFLKKLAIPKVLTRHEIESYINDFVKVKDKRITYMKAQKKFGFYNNRFIV